MNPIYKHYVEGITFNQELKNVIENFLISNNEKDTLEHTNIVANEASRIAILFDLDPLLAEQAGLLHDISNVIPIAEMMSAAEEVLIEINGWRAKISSNCASETFKRYVQRYIWYNQCWGLNAIECHTTLKSGASKLDKILWLAPKKVETINSMLFSIEFGCEKPSNQFNYKI